MSRSIQLADFNPEFGPQTIVAFDDMSTNDAPSIVLAPINIPSPDEEAFEEEGPSAAEIAQNLAQTISALSDDIASLYAETARSMSDNLGRTLQDLSPTLLDTTFAGEVAASIEPVLRRTLTQEAQLLVASDHYEDIVSATSGLALEQKLTLVDDPNLPAGTARLKWPDGGADFDCEALLEVALQTFANQMSAPAQSRSSNE